MTVAERLQAGIFFRSGEKPPPCFRLLLLDIRSGTLPADARLAIARIFGLMDELLAGRAVDLGTALKSSADLFTGVDMLLGVGRRLFDASHHDPPLTEHPRPAYLAYLDQRGDPFPGIPWASSPPQNRGEADIAVQITGPHDAAVNCAMVEIWKRIVDERLPLDPTAFFAGFGRPDGRGWLDFHDGVSNLESSQRRTAIEARGDPDWMAGGTFMAFLRFRIDLRRWRSIPRADQERIVGRDKLTGHPLGADLHDQNAFADPPETTSPELAASHIHRANQSRASPAVASALRMFRQGYDYLESIGRDGPELGLNFVSFQSDLATVQHLLHLPGWLGDVNFGGPAGPGSPSLITLADGGFYAVPPRSEPFPGAALLRPPDERQS